MTYYAKLDGTRIQLVVDTDDGRGEGWAVLSSPINWANQPSPNHRPHLINNSIVWQDNRVLADVKAAKTQLINQWRLEANLGGFSHQGKEIASDQLSMMDITNTANKVIAGGALPNNWPGGWKAKDNSYVSITTVAEWNAFYDSMYQQGLQNFITSQTLKAQVTAATTLEAIDAITWPT